MGFSYSIPEVARMCRGEVSAGNTASTTLSAVVTDSRAHHIPPGAVFFALRGERHDGHNYIPELLRNGIECIVAETDPPLTGLPHATGWITTDDTLKSLQRWATEHRKQFEVPVVAITGSNGKTIVKEWLSQLMAPDKTVCKSPLSYNSQVGVPLSVLQLSHSHQIGLFEAGISQHGEMESLNTIISPTIGVFTGIGASHDENFSSRVEKALEKFNLFKGCRDVVCFTDGEAFSLLQQEAKKQGFAPFTIGPEPWANLRVNLPHIDDRTETATATFRGNTFTITFPYTDYASKRNALLCLATMVLLGYDAEQSARQLTTLEQVAMRMEQVEGINGTVIINDSYNNDLIALHIALENLQHNKAREKKCLILSDIFQSGLSDSELIKQVAELINRYQPGKFIGVGPMMLKLRGSINTQAWFYEETRHFLRYHPFSVFSDEVILLKGARKFRFEQIKDALERQSHNTVLEINLGAIIHNLNYFRSIVPSGTRIMAMVKASSYGSGNFEVANVLQYHQVDYLGVAFADEGVELRKAGIRLPIMVMSPERGSFNTIIEHRLEPELYSFMVLSDFVRALDHHNTGTTAPFPVHIEVNTGMHRLGFDAEGITQLIDQLNSTPAINVKSVFSHLATAGDVSDHSFARQQIDLFNNIREQFLSTLKCTKPPMFHILNSDGIIHFPEACYDMVRPGIGLYGFVADAGARMALRQTGKLRSVVSQLRTIEGGETVGYNRSFTAQSRTTVATVAIGYADGFNRKLGNGNYHVSIHGVAAPVIGNVCMDMIMVDVSHIPHVAEGDEVIIFDENNPPTIMAETLGTIPYEVLTSIPSRVKRVFLSE